MFPLLRVVTLPTFALLAAAAPGQILPISSQSSCVAASSNADGAPLIIHNCTTEAAANEDWVVNWFSEESAVPSPIVVFGDKCIDVTNGVNADGTQLQVWTCADGNTNQQWTSLTKSQFQWTGTDKCLDLTNGVLTDGNVLQIWTCDETLTNRNQQWTRGF